MAVPTLITDLSTTAASNSPAGSDVIGTSHDDFMRAHAAFIAQLNATSIHWGGTGGGTVDAITITPSPAITAYATGQVFAFISSGANTSTTPTINVNGIGAKTITKNGTTALAAGDIKSGASVICIYDGTNMQLVGAENASTYSYIPVRQTVLSGPVTTAGLPDFAGSTGSTTVTATGTLTATAALGFSANGSADYIGQITNPSWTGLSTNGTMYLYLDITSGGVVTTGSTTLAPVYQWGGTYSTTNNQNTFNIQEMTMKVGNGATASQVYRVFVGEVTVAGAVVSAITWYALRGQYRAPAGTHPASGVATSFNHNLGTDFPITSWYIKCGTIDLSYAVGDFVSLGHAQTYSTTNQTAVTVDRLTAKYLIYGGMLIVRKDLTSFAAITMASWDIYVNVSRGW